MAATQFLSFLWCCLSAHLWLGEAFRSKRRHRSQRQHNTSEDEVSILSSAQYWQGVNMNSSAAIRARMASGAAVVSYNNLWTAYKSVWTNLPGQCAGSVFDIYSRKCWQPGTTQCGSYSKEGDCYNREHSWPKSWWGSTTTAAYSDMFHVMPSDGYVNGRRSSWPFGKVSNATYVSSEGHKVGPCSAGTCFEPTDRVKGLLARGNLYLSLRYSGQFSCCKVPAVDGSVLLPWTSDLLKEWNRAFPPQPWEVEVNNRIQQLQNNRNPFIDFPALAETLAF